jgi:hypothetical protein
MAKYQAIRDTVITYSNLQPKTVKAGTVIEALVSPYDNTIRTTYELKEPNFEMSGQAWGLVVDNDFKLVDSANNNNNNSGSKGFNKTFLYLGAAAIVLFIILKKK